jgi:glycosyltransferase involved in cell wall biosynthesis
MLTLTIKCLFNISFVNFGINFDDLDIMPAYKKVIYHIVKVKKYKSLMKNFLMETKPDITVSAMRREINFINDIPDGSKKVGEIHFSRIGYREVNIKFLPNFINHCISKIWFNKLLKEVERLSAFVVLTNEDKNNWPMLSNIHVIPNPVSFSPTKQSLCENKQVIAVGRYTYQKGFDLLIDAWAIVNKKHPDWTLNIYGGGDRDLYQKMADNKGLGPSFICNGAVNNIEEKYVESSFFVLSSRYEGSPMVLVEAMACGLPCISFSCPCGPKDIIHENVNGFLVDNGNVEQLAEEMIYTIEHPEKRKLMGIQAKDSVNRFKMNIIGKQWEKLFNNVIGG